MPEFVACAADDRFDTACSQTKTLCRGYLLRAEIISQIEIEDQSVSLPVRSCQNLIEQV